MRLQSLAVAAARRRRDLRLQHLREILLGVLRIVESPNDPLPSLSHVFSPSDWLVVDMRSSHRALRYSRRNDAGRADMCSARVPQPRGTWQRPPRRGRSWLSKPTACNEDPCANPLFAPKIGARHVM